MKVKEENGRLTNSEWIDFLTEQFEISRTSAKKMLHVMMQVKKEDNFKKQFSKRVREYETEQCSDEMRALDIAINALNEIAKGE